VKWGAELRPNARFELRQPGVEMRALAADSAEPDLQRGQRSQQRLLVPWHKILDALGWRSDRRVIDILGRGKSIANCLEGGFQARLPDTAAEAAQSLKSNPSNSCITTNGTNR